MITGSRHAGMSCTGIDHPTTARQKGVINIIHSWRSPCTARLQRKLYRNLIRTGIVTPKKIYMGFLKNTDFMSRKKELGRHESRQLKSRPDIHLCRQCVISWRPARAILVVRDPVIHVMTRWQNLLKIKLKAKQRWLSSSVSTNS